MTGCSVDGNRGGLFPFKEHILCFSENTFSLAKEYQQYDLFTCVWGAAAALCTENLIGILACDTGGASESDKSTTTKKPNGNM